MNKVSYHKGAIFVMVALTLMTGTLINGSVLAQPATDTTATGNATEPLTLSIYSKTSGIEYVYNNVENEQQFVNALKEVDAITHPELATGDAGAQDILADEQDNNLANNIFSLSAMTPTEPQPGEAETEVAVVASIPTLIAAGKFIIEDGDKIIKVAKTAKKWICKIFC